MITLPEIPAPAAASGSIIDFGGFVQPLSGGAVQRIDRMGNRWRMDFTMPPMRNVGAGMAFKALLVRAKTEGVRIDVPLLGFNPGSPGSVVVDGAGQSGRALNVRGATPGYQFRTGQWFSVVVGGRSFLYQVDELTIANGSGLAALPITPMIRKFPADGAALAITKPMIEGYVKGDEWSWTMSVDHTCGFQFSIEEMA